MTKITTVVEQIVVNIEQPVHKIVVRVGGGGGGGPVDWDNVQNKPGEFPPSAHTHEISEVVGLREEIDYVGEMLDQVSAGVIGYVFSYRGIVDGIASLDGDARIPLTQLPSHTHSIANITGLQAALDSRHITVSATPPSDPAENDLWYDTTAPLAERLKYFDGADWA